MDKILYDLMDWAGIEEIVYSEAAEPCTLLGPHMTEKGLLIQAYLPTAQAVSVKLTATGKEFPMEQADEAGFYAVLVPRRSMVDYTLSITYESGVQEIHDPYAYPSQYTEADLKKFGAGIHYTIYEKMGAHPLTIDGVAGVHFAVWAPCAMRVSVVGDFNLWDGRRHQMHRLGDSGIFELFIPGLKEGMLYKYEVKARNGDNLLKTDPYGSFSELRPNTASVIWNLKQYTWKDQNWITKRAETDTKREPMSIYEVHLGSWMRKPLEIDEEGRELAGTEFYNYRDLAVKLVEYVKDMGYTHVELMPVMEHPLDASWGYQVTGYYAPTSRYGTPDDFKYFIDYMHEQGIGVILDWVPAHFPRDIFGLACFDGTCVYEHKDPRQGSHPHWGTLIYNYGRPQVTNFLIANALYWAKEFHADGIRMDAVASMLYLDYGKNDGEWVPNIYGGHENLEAVEFLKHLNSIFKKHCGGAVLIAEESTAWPQITGKPKEGGLGFDYKWNMGWMNDFTGYMKYDPFFRCHHYGELTFSMLYAYSEDFILVFSHDEVVHGKGSMVGKMPGESLEMKFANLRAAYGFMHAHPGKKLLFMGQDFGQVDEWNENESVQWDLLDYPIHRQMKDYVRELNRLYRRQPALHQADYDPAGFQWVNCTDSADNIIVFLRQTGKKEETLLVVCNFAPAVHEKFQIGVPFPGKYKEIFNSDSQVFGGGNRINPRAKQSRQEEWDERPDSIQITVAPMSVQIFSCAPSRENTKAKGKTAEKKAPARTEKKKNLPAAAKGQKTGKTREKPIEEKPAAAALSEPERSKEPDRQPAEVQLTMELTTDRVPERSESIKEAGIKTDGEGNKKPGGLEANRTVGDQPAENQRSYQAQSAETQVTAKAEESKPAEVAKVRETTEPLQRSQVKRAPAGKTSKRAKK